VRVLHVLNSAATSWGGPPRVVRNLAAGLARIGVESTIVTLGDRRVPLVEFPEEISVRVCGNALFGYAQGGGAVLTKLALPPSLKMVHALLTETPRVDLVHLHEIWSAPHMLGALSSWIGRRPYVVSPHGELQGWALAQRSWLKRIAWRLYEKSLLRGASGFHAPTDIELNSIKLSGISAPVRVIPNGVDLEYVDGALERTGAPHGPGSGTHSNLLYVGRLAAGKGLEILLQAVAVVNKELRGASLLLLGPDEQGMWPGLRAFAQQLGINDQVTYLGMINEPYKYNILSSAGVFVLPSSSEGMSMSLLESLACGTPVVVSPNCNITQDELGIAGRVVQPEPTSIAGAVVDILRDRRAYAGMRQSARHLASSRFSSGVVAAQMMKFYKETLDGKET